jgi:hypothetical protein
MTSAGGQTFSVVIDRATLKVTISAANNFSLQVTAGAHSTSSCFSLIGFTTDRTGSNSYVADTTIGEIYAPQMMLQSFVSSEDYQESVDEAINECASGLIEVVRFGVIKKTQFSIEYATDIAQNNGVIDSNANAVSELREFMRWITQKRYVEFIPDKASTPFETLLLEKTENSASGTGYMLKEMYDKALPYYFSSGLLTFRIVEL